MGARRFNPVKNIRLCCLNYQSAIKVRSKPFSYFHFLMQRPFDTITSKFCLFPPLKWTILILISPYSDSCSPQRWRHPRQRQRNWRERLWLQHRRPWQRWMLPVHLRRHRRNGVRFLKGRRLVVQPLWFRHPERRLASGRRPHWLGFRPVLGDLEDPRSLFTQCHQNDDQVCVRWRNLTPPPHWCRY